MQGRLGDQKVRDGNTVPEPAVMREVALKRQRTIEHVDWWGDSLKSSVQVLSE
jgi:hypothetical protein